MTETPEPVLLWIPLMKYLGMSWETIKNTPNYELQGLLLAYNEYEELHCMDGYTDKNVSDMAKNQPSIRQTWHRYVAKQRKYKSMVGKQEIAQSFDTFKSNTLIDENTLPSSQDGTELRTPVDDGLGGNEPTLENRNLISPTHEKKELKNTEYKTVE